MADNIVCHCSFIGCLFGWRAGSIGELSLVNGQTDEDETPNVSMKRGRPRVMTASFL